jgi:hypothetical protein
VNRYKRVVSPAAALPQTIGLNLLVRAPDFWLPVVLPLHRVPSNQRPRRDTPFCSPTRLLVSWIEICTGTSCAPSSIVLAAYADKFDNGASEKDPRGCDESTWFVRLVSSLVVPIRDIVTGGPQLYWLFLLHQLGYSLTRRADHSLCFGKSATA